MKIENMHQPVMLEQVLKYLDVQPGRWYLDATVGDGGHTQAILERNGKVLGIDQDQEAIDRAKKRLNYPPNRLILAKSNFNQLEDIARQHHLTGFAGIFFDLGVSTYQLLEARRGFSFAPGTLLDMRMDTDLAVTAADLLAALSAKELTGIFRDLGDEPSAAAIARRIVNQRKSAPITTSDQLVKIIESVKKSRGKIHPATQVFQALRMAVNLERESLMLALPQALSLLAPQGRLVVISFHSGEDRVVKNFFREQALAGRLEVLTDKPLPPQPGEVKANPRARSARLRAARLQRNEKN